MNTTLTLAGEDFSGQYHDLAYYVDVNRETRTSTMLALAVENANGDLLTWLATHQGATVDVVAVTRGMKITGQVTVTGASRLAFNDAQPVTEPAS